MVFGDVTSTESLKAAGFRQPVDVVVSCLASRTGGVVSPAALYPMTYKPGPVPLSQCLASDGASALIHSLTVEKRCPVALIFQPCSLLDMLSAMLSES